MPAQTPKPDPLLLFFPYPPRIAWRQEAAIWQQKAKWRSISRKIESFYGRRRSLFPFPLNRYFPLRLPSESFCFGNTTTRCSGIVSCSSLPSHEIGGTRVKIYTPARE